MKRKLYFLLVVFACCLLSITQAKPECNEYKCSFLDCEPFSIQTTILVRDTLSIFSNSEMICKGSTAIFYTNTSGKVRWEIYDSNNSLIYSGKSDTLSYTFDISDSYKITASGARYSTTAEYRITVLENPPALTTTQGPNVACLFGSILLSGTPTHPNYYLEWEPQCALAAPSSVSGNEVTITYAWEVCDVAVYQVDNEYGCRSEAYIHPVDTFRLAPFSEPAITHVCAGAPVYMGVLDQSDNVTYEWTISPANAASVVGSNFTPNVEITTNHFDNLPVVATVTLKRTYCSNIVEYVTAQISIEDVTPPTVDYEDTICNNTRDYFYASGIHVDNYYTWVMDGTDTHHGYNTSYYFGTPGTHHFTLTYQPDPHCNAATVSGQVFVVDMPSVSITAINDTTLSVAQQANVTYSWTLNGDTIPNMHDTVCFVGDTGEYCCIVTSTIPPYCSNIACYSNEPSGPSQPDTCLPLVLTDSLISCNEAVIKAVNPTNATISWEVSPQYGYCSPSSSTDSTTAYFRKVGIYYISAYMVDNGQCYRGSIDDTINCIPGMKVRYDCDGHLIIYDTSKYRDGFTIPDRNITIDGTNISVPLPGPNLTISIPIANLPHGQYTVTMDMGMDVPCSVSREFIYEGNPTIDSFDIRSRMCLNTPFPFVAYATGTIAQYYWNFGDGSSNKGNGIYHTYHPDIVQYPTVILTVTDIWGCTAKDSVSVIVGGAVLEGSLDALGTPICPGQNRTLEYTPHTTDYLYYWNHSTDSTSNNQCNVTSTGDYYVMVKTIQYGCRAERMCNVGFLNAPTARITGNTEYCLGELVKLNGNTGNSNTYLWYVFDQDNTCVYTSTSSIIRFTPGAAGNYTVMLNVTSPDNCSAQAVYNFVVHPRPAAPKIIVSGCIHEPPVQAICVSGESLLWSNGYNGTQADYYTDGYISAYYVDATTGCPSEKAFEYIIPAPNYDALR